ncbi:MAG: IscS subfamily cysteine desulfurase [Planctomycetes bacterium]|nr:IscS subfamily cysteine desulfurase [Planctomycetota bacterium]
MANRQQTIYLDNAATTMVALEVCEAMLPFLGESYGNSTTLYHLGSAAQQAAETARQQVAGLLGAEKEEEIYFTSGGTESDNWAIISSVLGQKKRHLVISSIEHHAVLETCEDLAKLGLEIDFTALPVDVEGRVNPEELRRALRPDTALVSIMHANNEIGTVEPIRELAEIAHEQGVLFHTDAVQTAGKIPVDVKELGVDMLSLSGHKFHAPKGTGALYLRKGTRLNAFMHGGGHERNRRSGTVNIPGVVGLGKAAELAGEWLESEMPRLKQLTEKLWTGIAAAIPQVTRNSPVEGSLPGMLNVTVAGAEGEAMLMYLDMHHGICISSGSACTTGSLDPSHVLLAIGVPAETAHGSLRFSMSHYTTEAEIDTTIAAMSVEIEKVRAMSPTWDG